MGARDFAYLVRYPPLPFSPWRQIHPPALQVLNYGTHGVDRDHGAALAYFKLAAAAGDVDAMAHLGAMFANGYGTRRSYEQAVDWWTRAARRNNANALFGLGYLYLTARGVSQDYDRAFQYFSKAAEQVHAGAEREAAAGGWCHGLWQEHGWARWAADV